MQSIIIRMSMCSLSKRVYAVGVLVKDNQLSSLCSLHIPSLSEELQLVFSCVTSRITLMPETTIGLQGHTDISKKCLQRVRSQDQKQCHVSVKCYGVRLYRQQQISLALVIATDNLHLKKEISCQLINRITFGVIIIWASSQNI